MAAEKKVDDDFGFALFVELGSFSKVAEALNVDRVTVWRHAKAYHWEQRRDAFLADPNDPTLSPAPVLPQPPTTVVVAPSTPSTPTLTVVERRELTSPEDVETRESIEAAGAELMARGLDVVRTIGLMDSKEALRALEVGAKMRLKALEQKKGAHSTTLTMQEMAARYTLASSASDSAPALDGKWEEVKAIEAKILENDLDPDDPENKTDTND